ncbi:unnamed protein product [Closterium sp. Naga37s-1]|nr:unnamed protein product [Closterium sp. Naga37s-1]
MAADSGSASGRLMRLGVPALQGSFRERTAALRRSAPPWPTSPRVELRSVQAPPWPASHPSDADCSARCRHSQPLGVRKREGEKGWGRWVGEKGWVEGKGWVVAISFPYPVTTPLHSHSAAFFPSRHASVPLLAGAWQVKSQEGTHCWEETVDARWLLGSFLPVNPFLSPMLSPLLAGAWQVTSQEGAHCWEKAMNVMLTPWIFPSCESSDGESSQPTSHGERQMLIFRLKPFLFLTSLFTPISSLSATFSHLHFDTHLQPFLSAHTVTHPPVRIQQSVLAIRLLPCVL